MRLTPVPVKSEVLRTVENAVTLPVYPAAKATLTMLTVQYAPTLDSILTFAIVLPCRGVG